MAVEQLALERREEALAHRVVVRVPDRAHGWPHAHVAAALPEGDRRVLTALIGMMDYVCRSALREGHVQRLEDELRAEVRCHRPADDATAPRIEHDGEVEEAGPGWDVGDVRDPEPVGSHGGEVAVHEIGSGARLTIADRRADPLASAHAGQAH